MSDADIWLVIGLLAVGTYLIRFSFLGLIGSRPMPAAVLRLLRFTPVAVLPGMVAPLVLWPAATGGHPDIARLAAAAATLAAGLWRRNTLLAIAAGALTLYAGLWLLPTS
ncbi:MAG: AzlD domain-containing protein [Limimaricola sp.]|uniref:AzlD domain-containing protein n=1 Tax=Limimaricola sp. TaxID=2211665 RepID=UPI001D46AC69|nr:AzlD domain-containing protein [Limimaricola sp.]MBI1417386.1 AzlD domain-containing protein [Limimaricola sp.]